MGVIVFIPHMISPFYRHIVFSDYEIVGCFFVTRCVRVPGSVIADTPVAILSQFS